MLHVCATPVDRTILVHHARFVFGFWQICLFADCFLMSHVFWAFASRSRSWYLKSYVRSPHVVVWETEGGKIYIDQIKVDIIIWGVLGVCVCVCWLLTPCCENGRDTSQPPPTGEAGRWASIQYIYFYERLTCKRVVCSIPSRALIAKKASKVASDFGC